MKIYYYEYSDDKIKWHKGKSSFYATEIIKFAQQQPYAYKIYTVEFDPFFVSKEWSQKKINWAARGAEQIETVFNENKKTSLAALQLENSQLKSLLTKDQGCVTISRNGYVQKLEEQIDEARKEAVKLRDYAMSDKILPWEKPITKKENNE